MILGGCGGFDIREPVSDVSSGFWALASGFGLGQDWEFRVQGPGCWVI